MPKESKNKAGIPVAKKYFLIRMDDFLQKKQKIIFIISVVPTTIFSIMLFDPKGSASGDDSMSPRCCTG
jgi:hypothetical protein